MFKVTIKCTSSKDLARILYGGFENQVEYSKTNIKKMISINKTENLCLHTEHITRKEDEDPSRPPCQVFRGFLLQSFSTHR